MWFEDENFIIFKVYFINIFSYVLDYNKNVTAKPKVTIFSSMLSPIIIVLGLKTRFMISLQLMDIYSVMYGSKFVCFFSTWISKCSNTTYWKTILLHSIAFASLSKINCLCKCGFISGLVVYSTDQCFYLYAS